MGLPSGLHAKFVLSGSVSSSDVWNTGIWMGMAGAPTQADLDGLSIGCLNTFKSQFWSAAASPWAAQCSTGTKISDVKTYLYNNGLLVMESAVTQTAVAGSAAGQSPAYCATVFSLKTASFGRTARGRMYLPHTGGIYNSGSLSLPVVQAHCDNFRNWIALAGSGGWDSIGGTFALLPEVVSRVGAGTWRLITQVRLDDVPDTQRGRISNEKPGSVFIKNI
jgi:hypothetical protein